MASFTFGTIGGQTAGTAFNVSVTAYDSNNERKTSFNGTVDLTTTAATITPAVSGSFSGGGLTQSVTLTGAGPGQTITATDAGGSGSTGTSGAFTLYPSGRRLEDVRLAVMMLDGIELQGPLLRRRARDRHRGREAPARAVGRLDRERDRRRALLTNLVERGLDLEQGVLFVIDGGKALRKAINEVFGDTCPFNVVIRHYADVRVMPTRLRKACSGGRIGVVEVGIIRALRGRRGACRVAGSGRAGVSGGVVRASARSLSAMSAWR